MAATAASTPVHDDAERAAGSTASIDALAQLPAATQRLLSATARLGEAEITYRAASGLGTRKHVIARLARRARRIGMDAAALAAATPSADGLLHCSATELVAALEAALLAALDRLDSEPGASVVDGDVTVSCALEHLAWLELTHVDLAVGYELHDVPVGSQPAIAAHLHRVRDTDGGAFAVDDGDGTSPFALLFAPED